MRRILKPQSKAVENILRGYTKESLGYLDSLQKDCNRAKIKLSIVAGKNRKLQGMPVSGFFCETREILAFSLGKGEELAMQVAIHEASHMEQWLDKSSIWYDDANNEKMAAFWRWLEKKSSASDPLELSKAVIALEADCERRSLAKLSTQLPTVINPAGYAKGANAYMYLYLHMAESRYWPSTSVYTKKDIMELCSPTFCEKFDRIPPKLLEKFHEHFPISKKSNTTY